MKNIFIYMIMAMLGYMIYTQARRVDAVRNQVVCVNEGYTCDTIKECRECVEMLKLNDDTYCTTDADCEERYGY